jgi:hypothetical protein
MVYAYDRIRAILFNTGPDLVSTIISMSGEIAWPCIGNWVGIRVGFS